MKDFLRAMRWGMELKYSMCLYGLGLLMVKWVVALLQGTQTIPVWDVFWMTLAGLLLAVIQYFCFAYRQPSPEQPLVLRSIIWVASANAIIIGASAALDWFPGLAPWGYALLIATLNFGMLMLWVGVHIAQKFDTDALNRSLRAFQQKE